MNIEIGLEDGIGSLCIDYDAGGRDVDQVTDAIYETLAYTPFPVFTDRNKGNVIVARSKILYLQIVDPPAPAPVPVAPALTPEPPAEVEQSAPAEVEPFGPVAVSESFGPAPARPVLVGV